MHGVLGDRCQWLSETYDTDSKLAPEALALLDTAPDDENGMKGRDKERKREGQEGREGRGLACVP